MPIGRIIKNYILFLISKLYETNLTILTILGLAFFFNLSAQVVNPLQDPDFKYSENNIPKYIKEAAETKQDRINHAFENATGKGLRQGMVPYFANLWLGKDLKKTNEILLDILTTKDTEIQEKYRLNDPWCLATNQLLYHMYYSFGSKGTLSPGRIYPKTEKAMPKLRKAIAFFGSSHRMSRQAFIAC